MDHAVALVRAYLQVNGYFTVTEYPILGTAKYSGYQTVTDIDVLAFRFAGAGRLVASESMGEAEVLQFEPDPELGVPREELDMLIGEVKEGRARINENMIRKDVLEVTLIRFGCCTREHAPALVSNLLENGQATSPNGHRVRLVVFASSDEPVGFSGCQVITLGHITRFLMNYMDDYWDILHHTHFKDSAFGFLMMLKKAWFQIGLRET